MSTPTITPDEWKRLVEWALGDNEYLTPAHLQTVVGKLQAINSFFGQRKDLNPAKKATEVFQDAQIPSDEEIAKIKSGIDQKVELFYQKDIEPLITEELDEMTSAEKALQNGLYRDRKVTVREQAARRLFQINQEKNKVSLEDLQQAQEIFAEFQEHCKDMLKDIAQRLQESIQQHLNTPMTTLYDKIVEILKISSWCQVAFQRSQPNRDLEEALHLGNSYENSAFPGARAYTDGQRTLRSLPTGDLTKPRREGDPRDR